MTAGVPGAGIAGLFYLAAALLAPLWNLVRRSRRQPSARRWSFVARLAVLALSMLSGIALAGLLIGLALTSASAIAHVPGAYAHAPTAPFVIARLTVFLTLGTLVAVLAGVEVLALFASPRRLAARRARGRAPIPTAPK
jgi:hypothetical protein